MLRVSGSHIATTLHISKVSWREGSVHLGGHTGILRWVEGGMMWWNGSQSLWPRPRDIISSSRNRRIISKGSYRALWIPGCAWLCYQRSGMIQCFIILCLCLANICLNVHHFHPSHVRRVFLLCEFMKTPLPLKSEWKILVWLCNWISLQIPHKSVTQGINKDVQVLNYRSICLLCPGSHMRTCLHSTEIS